MAQPTLPASPNIATSNPGFPHESSLPYNVQDDDGTSVIYFPQSQRSSICEPHARSVEIPGIFSRRTSIKHNVEEHGPTTVLPPPAETESDQLRHLSISSSTSRPETKLFRRGTACSRVDYQVPEAYANLDEVAVPSPVQNSGGAFLYRSRTLEAAGEEERIHQQDRRDSLRAGEQVVEGEEPAEVKGVCASNSATQLYTHCYLIFFSILGTLARLGLESLTEYPGAPVTFGVVWANFGGCLVMGFLSEDRMLFLEEWGIPVYDEKITKASKREDDSGSGGDSRGVDLEVAKKTHLATKKTIPLYIGLATGFCGSFTSFSSFIRDSFLAISNDLVTAGVDASVARNGGYSFMALVSVILTTMCLSLSALFIGAHLAITLEPMTPSLPFKHTRKFVDPLAVPLSFGAWLAVVLLAIFPPDAAWRGDALFALVFAPIGCLARFYASIHLNGRLASFPLGTFVANVAGTAVLGMCWDLAHVPVGGVVGCQVLKGVQDGFCGCLTTVSTLTGELATLRKDHAYIYGGLNIGASIAVLVAIMGGLRWSYGFESLMC